MPRSPQGLMAGIVARLLANMPVQPDSQDDDAGIRLGANKELFTLGLFSGLEGFADEGSLYAFTTAAPGTGVVSSPATQVAFAETAGVLCITNTDTKKRLYLLYLEELITAAPTASTSKHVAHSIDSLNRNPTRTGTQLIGRNMSDGSPLSDGVADIFLGTPTIVAQGGARRFLGRDVVRTQIPVVNDLYAWTFGRRDPAPLPFSQPATAIQQVFNRPQVIIPPGGSYVMHEWSPARTAAESAEWLGVYAVR